MLPIAEAASPRLLLFPVFYLLHIIAYTIIFYPNDTQTRSTPALFKSGCRKGGMPNEHFWAETLNLILKLQNCDLNHDFPNIS